MPSPITAELLAHCGTPPLPGGVVIDVPLFGPPLSVVAVSPEAGRIFVAAVRAVVGYPAHPRGAICGKPDLEVPVEGFVIRVHCGSLGDTCPAVAAVDDRGGVTAFRADAPALSGAPPSSLRLRCEGTPGGGMAFVPFAANRLGGYLLVGNDRGQLCRWELGASSPEAGLVLHGTSVVAGLPHEAMVVDISARADGELALAASLDGTLALWDIEATSVRARSMPEDRRDCSETPSVWGTQWLRLSCVQTLGVSEHRSGRAEGGKPSEIQWASLPGELICRCLLHFLSLRDLACSIACMNRQHKAVAESELTGSWRTECLALCYSDGEAWLLDQQLRMLVRQGLPFCAAHAHGAPVLQMASVLVAPKTDLVALPGPALAVMPHVWVLTCFRNPGTWAVRLQVRRVDLRPAHDAVVAAADLGISNHADDAELAAAAAAAAAAAGPVPPVPGRQPAHVLGLDTCTDDIWALLASGELLMLHAGPEYLQQ
eukprot:gnl/TRDRNA2_/TRDRNA2_200699_c0_seq1.p1 gnl/TRDRNA2_/TRDRNA2_200699_c0~~gnl/TRDRNA2_/TRDRNA2_200699_c0_seq1.p1  ORF type:complete len:486 (-),score=61.98 gnl/TRDRNA2_/TRDRNA2_200699_c0_seq1:41-1498(-)